MVFDFFSYVFVGVAQGLSQPAPRPGGFHRGLLAPLCPTGSPGTQEGSIGDFWLPAPGRCHGDVGTWGGEVPCPGHGIGRPGPVSALLPSSSLLFLQLRLSRMRKYWICFLEKKKKKIIKKIQYSVCDSRLHAWLWQENAVTLPFPTGQRRKTDFLLILLHFRWFQPHRSQAAPQPLC